MVNIKKSSAKRIQGIELKYLVSTSTNPASKNPKPPDLAEAKILLST